MLTALSSSDTTSFKATGRPRMQRNGHDSGHNKMEDRAEVVSGSGCEFLSEPSSFYRRIKANKLICHLPPSWISGQRSPSVLEIYALNFWGFCFNTQCGVHVCGNYFLFAGERRNYQERCSENSFTCQFTMSGNEE